MSASTTIEWTDFTFNPWWGCSRISRGCRGCYAAGISTRFGHDVWRRSGPRRMMSDRHWAEPLVWQQRAARQGRSLKVFCASMADVGEIHPVAAINAQLDAARARLWTLIERTPSLNWQLLSKRPENLTELTPWGKNGWPPNVWVGTSVEDQQRAEERIPLLLNVPAAVRFLSCEPLVEPLDLRPWLRETLLSDEPGRVLVTGDELHWVIVGGESGPKAQPMHPDWARDLRDQCVAASVPFFFKQHGRYRPANTVYGPGETEADWDPANVDVVGAGVALNPDGSRPIQWDSRHLTIAEPPAVGAWWMQRVGMKGGGRILDGRTWDEFPAEVSR